MNRKEFDVKTTRFRILLVLIIGTLLGLLLPLWMKLNREIKEADTELTTIYPPYSLIEDGLYMGGFSKKIPPGTQAVLNLSESPALYKSDFYEWSPIPDSAPAPSIDWLKKQVDFVDTQRRAGRTVYVHCAAGVSRSGMVVTAYEMQKNRWTRDKALLFVRSKRPNARPNPAFMDLLLKWERMVKKTADNGTGVKRFFVIF